MYILITRLKTKDKERWDKWNRSTFNLRAALGLKSVQAFKKLDDADDEYIAISKWDNLEGLKKYLSDESVKVILGEKEVRSFDLYEYLEEYSIEG